MKIKYLLDTNICIYALNNRHPALKNKLLSVHPEEIGVSSITLYELAYGAGKRQHPELTWYKMQLFLANYNTLAFDAQDSVTAGNVRAQLEIKGTPIGPYDVLIASQALVRGLTIVTHNTREFMRIPGLPIEDWTEIN